MYMNINSLKLRYINGQCYEFVLPNGKHIITDPFITPQVLSGFRQFNIDEIERCDYILLTHAHYDHTADIGTLCKKFGCKLLAGEMCIMSVAECFDIDLSQLIPLSNLCPLELPDFTVLPVRGKHYGTPGRLPRERFLNLSEEKFGIKGHSACDIYGCVETYDFCITLSNNVRLMYVSGVDYFNNIYTVAAQFHPNILIRHTAGSGTGAMWAKVINRFQAQVAFPSHHDNVYSGKWGKTMDEFSTEIQQELDNLGSQTRFVNPIPYKWYNLTMGIEVE